jgi:hypothetical protein
VTGGTGTKSWGDKNGGLTGTGLTISAGGVVSGTVSGPQTISFTARVQDGVGSSAEKLFTFTVAAAFVCGDANDDEAVNIGDAVYIISYVFRGGPEPVPLAAADANNDGAINVGDAVYLIGYIFRGGPAPKCS